MSCYGRAVILSACYYKVFTRPHKALGAPRWKLWSTSSMAMRRFAQQWTILLRCSIHMEQHCFQVRKHINIERLLFGIGALALYPDLEREDCMSIVDKSIPLTVISRFFSLLLHHTVWSNSKAIHRLSRLFLGHRAAEPQETLQWCRSML